MQKSSIMLKQFIPFQSIKYFISCDKIRNPRNTERNFDFRKEKKKKRKPQQSQRTT